MSKLHPIGEKLGVSIMLAILAFIYILLPNSNHLADSYGYGASVKYGVDLFQPHHLLYTGLNYLLLRPLLIVCPGLDTLRLMQFLNALFSLASLFLLMRILISKGVDRIHALWLTFAVGCSFSVMRFSVEAEVYIVPIFFSLLSSCFYQRYLRSKHSLDAFYGGLMASLACLFHQIHLFWGVGLFVGWLMTKNKKAVFLFLLSTPLVLVVYGVVLFFYHHQTLSISALFHFLASYYYSSNADTGLGLMDVLITIITFFRTFFQVHGMVLEVYKIMPVVAIMCTIAVLSFMAKCVIDFFKDKSDHKFGIVPSKSFEFTHLIVFALQFSFAFYSHGNSEFMVMLPFLIVIIYSDWFSRNIKSVKYLACAMLLWNLIFGILPNHFIDFQNYRTAIDIIRQEKNFVLVTRERTTPVNLYFYLYGMPENKRIIEPTDSVLVRKYKKEDAVFLTDMLSKNAPYSRVNFTKALDVNNIHFVRHIRKVKAQTGDFYIDEVKFCQ